MKSKIIFVTFILFVFNLQSVFSQVHLNKTAQSTMNFLLVGTSPKACALGEAFTCIGNGSESMLYNPAGLTEMETDFDININYTQWIADINYLGGGVAWKIGEFGVIGFNLLTVDYGVINGTSLVPESEEANYPLGYIDNGPVSNVGAYSVGVSYAKAISREFSIGGNIKIAGQNLGQNSWDGNTRDNNAAKLVFDAGVRYNTGFKDFTFGMSIRNFATNIKREEIEEQLPLLFSFGSSINLLKLLNEEPAKDSRLVIAIDFLHPNNYSERVNIGMEYYFMGMISLRGGYQTNRDLASWSGGVGFNTSISSYDLEVNYSYSRFEYFDSVNRVSLVFSF